MGLPGYVEDAAVKRRNSGRLPSSDSNSSDVVFHLWACGGVRVSSRVERKHERRTQRRGISLFLFGFICFVLLGRRLLFSPRSSPEAYFQVSQALRGAAPRTILGLRSAPEAAARAAARGRCFAGLEWLDLHGHVQCSRVSSIGGYSAERT